MQKLFGLFLVVFISMGNNKLSAQVDNTDSLQRVVMKDSLLISDTLITQIFAVRNNFLEHTAALEADTTITEIQRESAIGALVSQTNNQIRLILGSAKFDLYIQMIRRRMTNRPSVANATPLASQ